MDVLGTAVGVASLGIQVCQGLLTYYESWKDYDSDIAGTFDLIAGLKQTFTVLHASLNDDLLDTERADLVKSCLRSCEDALLALAAKSRKLRKHEQPEGVSQRLQWEAQRIKYPFLQKTLKKLKDAVNEIQAQLHTAMDILNLDSNQKTLKGVVAVQQSQVNIQQSQDKIQLSQLTIQQSQDHMQKSQDALKQTINEREHSEKLRRIAQWLNAPNPWTNHETARRSHEPNTGQWLMRDDSYAKWKAGPIRHLWLSGKPGSGKTVLSSTVIEDMRAHTKARDDVKLAAFYFTFSDKQKQTYEDLLRSVLEQLGCTGRVSVVLQDAYDKATSGALGVPELEKLVIASIQSYKSVYFVLDALDESPEEHDARHEVLQGLEMLSKNASSLKILATSREHLDDINTTMSKLHVQAVPLETSAVNADIRTYVSRLLAQDRRLSKMDDSTKALVEETLTKNADGMFRWVYCQISELQKLKSQRRKYVEIVLRNLPKTLDETYERILTSIDDIYSDEALSLLRWIAFAHKPLTLTELSVAASIRLPATDGDEVDFIGDEDFESPVNILAGLVTIVPNRNYEASESDGDSWAGSDIVGPEGSNSDATRSCTYEPDRDSSVILETSRVYPNDRLRLAHFSVREYLASSRILDNAARRFFLEKKACDLHLAHSCIAYVRYYSADDAKTRTKEDFIRFPLLKYASSSWDSHLRQSATAETACALTILNNKRTRDDWLQSGSSKHWGKADLATTALYQASSLGFEQAVQTLLDMEVDFDEIHGSQTTPLAIASARGHGKIVQMLLNAGADVNAAPRGESALSAASVNGHHLVAQILLHAGANVNAQTGFYGNVLQAGVCSRDPRTVQILLDAGADVNAQSHYFDNALQLAGIRGDIRLIQMLLDAGADVNAQDRTFGNVLLTAVTDGHIQMIQMLLDAGANVNARIGKHGNVLEAALLSDQGIQVIRILLHAGADVNAPGEDFANPLQAALYRADFSVVLILLHAGADVNAPAPGITALQAALRLQVYFGQHTRSSGQLHTRPRIVRALLDAGADVNTEATRWTALRVAAGISKRFLKGAFHDEQISGYRVMVVKMLLEAGASVDGTKRHCRALQAASALGHDDVVQILLGAGADVNAQVEWYGTALMAAASNNKSKVVKMLLDAGADVNAYAKRRHGLMRTRKHGRQRKKWRTGWYHGTALLAASFLGYHIIAKMLINAGADCNAQGAGLQVAMFGEYQVAKYAKDEDEVEADNYSDVLQAAIAGKTRYDIGDPLYAYYDRGKARNYDQTIELLVESGAVLRPELKM